MFQVLAGKRTAYCIIAFTVSGFLLRLLLTDYNNLGYDAKIYYEYASTLALQGHYPDTARQVHNVGWILFLVPFHKIVGINQELLFSVQQTLSIILSTATIPLSYLFAKRFVKSQFVLIVPLLFAVDYRMALNAGLGITEPLFLCLSLAACTVKNRALMFVFAGLACLVRVEGIMLIPVLLILDRKALPFMIIPLVILGVLFFVNSSMDHKDQIVTTISHEISFANTRPDTAYWADGFANSIKYMVWAAFPTFVFSVFGFDKKILLITFILSLSGLWAYLDAYDTRYFFSMYPFLAVTSALAIQKLHKVKNVLTHY